MPSVFKIDPPPFSPLGDTVPALTKHAVSVSLPTWQDVVDYEEGEQRIKDAMTSGYPRFFIHHQIQKVSVSSISSRLRAKLITGDAPD
jgi:cystathionine gamma-synthase